MSVPPVPPVPPGSGPEEPDDVARPDADRPVPEWLEQAAQGTYAGAQQPPEGPAPTRGYLSETYPASGYGSAPDDPPPPWAARPAPGAPGFGAGPYPPGGGYGAPTPHAGPSPYGAPGPYGGAPAAGPAPYGGPGPYGGPAPQGAPGPYGASGYAVTPYGGSPYGWAAAPPPYDGMAIAALVTGAIALFSCIGIFAGPVALGLGIASMRRITTNGTRGKGMAIAGIALGALCTVLAVLALVGFAVDSPPAFLR